MERRTKVSQIKVSIIRHGLAGDPEEYAKTHSEDDSRPLTTKGKQRLKSLKKQHRVFFRSIDKVFSSPLTRAHQTGEVLFKENLIFVDQLKPGHSPKEVTNWLQKNLKKSNKHVALIGHEPQLSSLIKYLLVGDDRLDLKIKVRKGSVTVLSFEDAKALAGKGTLLAHFMDSL